MRIKSNSISCATVVLITIAALLPGCVVSKDALFNSSGRVRPLSEGNYQKQEYVVGNWVVQKRGRLTIAGSNYTWSEKIDDEDSKEGLKFTLHKIDTNFFVAMHNSSSDEQEYTYDLLQMTDDGVLQYNVECDSARRVLGIDSPGIKRDGGKCIVASVADLTSLLRAYAKRSFPSYRYVRERNQ